MIGWLGLASLLPTVAARPLPSAADEDLCRRLASLARYPTESARAIGRAYLGAVPEEGCADRLRRMLGRAIASSGQEAAALSDESLAAVLRRVIQADFESDEIVSVRGWILSRTEARLCALFELVTP